MRGLRGALAHPQKECSFFRSVHHRRRHQRLRHRARCGGARAVGDVLAEQGDLAQATSSASTKLFHGGLRYLEYFEFRLVREALEERETLLVAMPHISWPMRFVLPLHRPTCGSTATRRPRGCCRG
jgi:glycerol-3-phosphate dehydrogenase